MPGPASFLPHQGCPHPHHHPSSHCPLLKSDPTLYPGRPTGSSQGRHVRKVRTVQGSPREGLCPRAGFITAGSPDDPKKPRQDQGQSSGPQPGKPGQGTPGANGCSRHEAQPGQPTRARSGIFLSLRTAARSPVYDPFFSGSAAQNSTWVPRDDVRDRTWVARTRGPRTCSRAARGRSLRELEAAAVSTQGGAAREVSVPAGA